MIKTKKHIAIISLMFCLMASLTLAFGFGNAAKANAEGEESYTLTFLGDQTNMIKDGWAAGYGTITDDVLTLSFASGTNGYSPEISLKNGKTYVIKMDIRTDADGGTGCWVYADKSNTGEQSWDCIFKNGTTTGDATINGDGVISGIGANWSTVSVDYTPTADISYLRFTDWNSKNFQLKNFTIAEKYADDITVTAGAAIGELPAVPEKAGYAGHWEIDGNAISSETVYNFGSDKNAVPAYEKIYALSFLGEPKNMIKDGWTDGCSIESGVLTLAFDKNNYAYSPNLTLMVGKKYIVSYEHKTTDAENDTKYRIWETTWKHAFVESETVVKAGADWEKMTFEYKYTTGTAGANVVLQMGLQKYAGSALQLKNFTITEVVDTKTYTKAGAIGELPAVPEKTGYIGHWEMDGEVVTAETNFAATEDKVATAVYEKAYTLTFITNETTFDSLTSVADAAVDGFVVNYSADWGYVKTNGVTITNGKKYKLEIVAKKTSGDGQLFVLYDAGGSVDGVFHTLADDYATLTIEFTAEKGATGILLQSSKKDTVFDFESIVLTEFETRTLKADQKVGELPEIPCGANYTGKWYIGENEVTEDTTIAQDEIATPVTEYSGHIFKNSEFAFVEAKNTTKAGENTATYAIEYNGTEEVESWTDKVWATGQFKTQAVTLNVKKSDGTEATIVSSQMQLDKGILWFSFTSKVFGDIVEITIPAGEYKLTDGTGFKLEAITFYMVHYNCGVNEKTYYTVEHVAEVKETCTTDGCLDYYYCAKCGRYFEDEDCVAEIENIDEWKADEEGGFIERLGHDFETEWTSDATKHWHKCTRCDAKKDEAEHVDSNNDKVCDECGASLGADEPDSSSSGSSDSSTDSSSSSSSGSSSDGSSSGSGTSTDDSTSDGGCFSGISAIPFVLVIMLFASACAIFLRKNKESGK